MRGGQVSGDGTFSGTKMGIVLKSKFTREEVDAYLYFTESLGGSVGLDLFNNVAEVDNPDSQYFIKYEVELADYVVENKAQFDGRFFVKIEKDPIVETITQLMIMLQVLVIFQRHLGIVMLLTQM